MRKLFGKLSRRIARSKTVLIGGVAMVVGLGTGVGVWLFKYVYALLSQFMYGNVAGALAPAGKWTIALIPMAGGILVGLLVQRFLKDEKLHGTVGVIQSVALAGGRLRYQKAPLNTFAAILSIGMGASVGPEDPSVQIGSNLGSLLGQWLRMSDERMRMLVAAGAASAIAAAFNAPIAGVFFALELILGEIGGTSLGLILVAAVTSALFTQAVSGSSPAFQLPPYQFHTWWELPLYLGLGLIAGPVSALYVQLVYRFQDLFNRVNSPRWIVTGAAGLIVGITGIFLPQVLGVGYGTIGVILNKAGVTMGLMLALLLGKLFLTPISIGSGFVGGVFAPALFIGAALGGAFGLGVESMFPSLGLTPAAFALVGMAAVLAGAVHAPLTAVILLFEMTNDYRIILPLMFAVAVSLLLSQRIQRDSIYAMGLARHGIRLDRGRDVEVLAALTVEDAMHASQETLRQDLSLEKAADIILRSHHHGLPVVDGKGRLAGILTVKDLESADPTHTVGQACTREVEVAFPDESLNIAIRRMSRLDVGHLPVVSRSDPGRLMGMLGRADIIRAYNVALSRRSLQRGREDAIRLDALTPARVDVTDVVVEKGAEIIGKKISEVAFPHDCVIASLRRGEKVFIPHGSTVINRGDVLIVVAQGEALDSVMRLCAGSAQV